MRVIEISVTSRACGAHRFAAARVRRLRTEASPLGREELLSIHDSLHIIQTS
jgi:hypothetical protein